MRKMSDLGKKEERRLVEEEKLAGGYWRKEEGKRGREGGRWRRKEGQRGGDSWRVETSNEAVKHLTIYFHQTLKIQAGQRVCGQVLE